MGRKELSRLDTQPLFRNAALMRSQSGSMTSCAAQTRLHALAHRLRWIRHALCITLSSAELAIWSGARLRTMTKELVPVAACLGLRVGMAEIARFLSGKSGTRTTKIQGSGR